jgi:hypothetical protein
MTYPPKYNSGILQLAEGQFMNSISILWALVAQTGIIIGGVIVVILFNNARFADMNGKMDKLETRLVVIEGDLRQF